MLKENILLENVRNGADGQKAADTTTQEPPQLSCANVAKKGAQREPLESEKKAVNAPQQQPALTFKK